MINFEVLTLRFQENTAEYLNNSTSILNVHEFRAVAYLFNEQLAMSLGLSHDENKWPKEEVARFGIGKFNKNGSFEFNNETYAEKLTAKVAFEIFTKTEKPSEPQRKFLIKILGNECKFKVARLFIDEILQNIEEKVCFKLFKSGKITGFIVNLKKTFSDTEVKIVTVLVNERLANLFAFILKSIKTKNFDLRVRALIGENRKYGHPNFIKNLSRVKSEFGKLLNVFFS